MENINKKRTGKLLLVLNILMLFALITVPTYAFFWNDRVEDNKNIVSGTVTEGLVIVEESALDPNKELIPSSAQFSNEALETKELVYTITVGLANDGKLNEKDLKVSVTDLGFLKHSVSKTEVDDNNVTVTIKFTIDLGANEWTKDKNGYTHNVKVNLSLVEDTSDPIA